MFKRLFSIVSKCILSVKELAGTFNKVLWCCEISLIYLLLLLQSVRYILTSCRKYQVLLLPSPRGYKLIQIFNTTRICRPYSAPQVVYVWKAPDIGFCPPFYWGNKQYKQTNSEHRMYWHHQSATFHTSTCRHQTFLLFFSCLPKIIKVSEYLYDLRFIHISFITKFWSAMADEQISGSGFSVSQWPNTVSPLWATVWCDVILLCGVSWQYVLILLATSRTNTYTLKIHSVAKSAKFWLDVTPFLILTVETVPPRNGKNVFTNAI